MEVPEAQVSVIGEYAVPEEEGRQFPVERRVERLAHADHDIAVNIGNNSQIVGDVELRLARFELQFHVAR